MVGWATGAPWFACLQVGQHSGVVAAVISHPCIVVDPRRGIREAGAGFQLLGLLARHRHWHTCRGGGWRRVSGGWQRRRAEGGLRGSAPRTNAAKRGWALPPPICRLHKGAERETGTHPYQAAPDSSLLGCYDMWCTAGPLLVPSRSQPAPAGRARALPASPPGPGCARLPDRALATLPTCAFGTELAK